MATRLSAPMAGEVEVLFLVLPDTLLLDLAGPAEAFRLANQRLRMQGLAPLWRLRFVGPQTEVDSSVGLQLAQVEPLPTALPRPSWVFLLGRPGEAHEVVRPQPAWLAARHWLAQVMAPALAAPGCPHRLLTVCSGALLAADAGLLHQRQCTTHHELVDELEAMAPDADVLRNRIFVQDGSVYSSAGVTAGIDLALHCIAAHAGEALASAVAQVMVVFHRRAAGDPERSPLLACRNHLHPAVHRVQNAVCERPELDWTLTRLAEAAHVTPRHLGRLFQQHTGLTPRDYVEQVRVALMQQALAADWPLQRALDLAGFASDRQWRRARARRLAPSALSPGADRG